MYARDEKRGGSERETDRAPWSTRTVAQRTFAELSLGTLRPMDEAIPEIAGFIAAENAAERARRTRLARRPEGGEAEHAKERRAGHGERRYEGNGSCSAPRRAKGVTRRMAVRPSSGGRQW